MLRDGWYWYSTHYACGGVRLVNGHVVEACPIFKNMKSWSPAQVEHAMRRNQFIRLEEEAE